LLKNFTKESTNEIDEKDILRIYTKDENTTVTIGSKIPSSVDFHIFPPSPISNSDSSSSYEGKTISQFLGVVLKKYTSMIQFEIYENNAKYQKCNFDFRCKKFA